MSGQVSLIISVQVLFEHRSRHFGSQFCRLNNTHLTANQQLSDTEFGLSDHSVSFSKSARVRKHEPVSLNSYELYRPGHEISSFVNVGSPRISENKLPERSIFIKISSDLSRHSKVLRSSRKNVLDMHWPLKHWYSFSPQSLNLSCQQSFSSIPSWQSTVSSHISLQSRHLDLEPRLHSKWI
jgi:hypothetical protein